DDITSIANYLTDIVGDPSISIDVKEDLIWHIKEAAFKIADYAIKEAMEDGACQVSNCDELEKNALAELGKGLRGYEDDLFVNSVNHYTNAWKIAQNMLGNDYKKIATSVRTEIPDKYMITQNYPNPFNPTTQIKFGLPEAKQVKLQIFDILGNLVTTLVDGPMEAGYHNVNWNASGYASGVYFYRISSGNFIKTMKLMLLK
ncbi:T9SS type A sorting domain-containing protein, partial [bacterium BMS3Abin03]|nr:T9SS type A sorting domain-containing protein [bacterium BMS3Abin03]